MELLEATNRVLYLCERSDHFNSKDGLHLSLHYSNRNDIENEGLFSEITIEKIGSKEVNIDLSQFPGMFFDNSFFIQYCKLDTFDSEFVILFYQEGDYIYFDPSTGKYQNSTGDISIDRYLSNIRFYLYFFDSFKNSSIVVYHDNARRQFIVFSPEKGNSTLGYPLHPPHIPSEVDIEKNFTSFSERNDSQDFQIFLRNQIIDTVSRYGNEQRFPVMVYSIDNILEASQRDFEFYLNKFSFEKLKENFRKERDQYFSAIRDMLNQTLNKIISIPISISAAALAVYNLKSDPEFALLIVLAFIIYSLFTGYLLRILRIDVSELNNNLIEDLQKTKKYSNIPIDVLESEGKKVFTKIDRLRTAICSTQVILVILSVAIMMEAFLIITFSNVLIIALMFVILAIHIIVSFVTPTDFIEKNRNIM